MRPRRVKPRVMRYKTTSADAASALQKCPANSLHHLKQGSKMNKDVNIRIAKSTSRQAALLAAIWGCTKKDAVERAVRTSGKLNRTLKVLEEFSHPEDGHGSAEA